MIIGSPRAFALDKVVTIVSDVWCPYNCDAANREQGFMIDVTREILSRVGYDVRYVNQTWSAALSDVASGRMDAVVGSSQSEAKDLVLAGEPLGENRTCFFTREDDPFVYRQGMSLLSRRVGAIAGYLYGDPIDSYLKEHRADYNQVQFVVGDKPLLQNIRKLKASRIDTVIENAAVRDFSVRKYLIAGIRNGGCDEPVSLYIAFSPKREDAGRLADAMSKGIRELRKKGRMHDILVRYGLKDWK